MPTGGPPGSATAAATRKTRVVNIDISWNRRDPAAYGALPGWGVCSGAAGNAGGGGGGGSGGAGGGGPIAGSGGGGGWRGVPKIRALSSSFARSQRVA